MNDSSFSGTFAASVNVKIKTLLENIKLLTLNFT